MKTNINFQSPSLPVIRHQYSSRKLFVTFVEGKDLEVDNKDGDFYVSCSPLGVVDSKSPAIYPASQLVGRDNVFIVIKKI